MKALIVLNGNINDLNTLFKLGKEADFILCADGGANYCLKAHLMPNMIIGDLDSISKSTLRVIRENRIPIKKFPIKKNATDSELGIDYLIGKGFNHLTIMGAIGNRMDHTLGNILLLNKLNQRKVVGRIIDENNTLYLVEEELKLDREKNSYVSLIPITSTGATITLKGFEYRLDKTKVNFGSTLGISNRIIDQQGYISIHEGRCLVIISKD